MQPSLLFITRSWQGIGGMQRLSRDMWDGWKVRYGTHATLCALEGRLCSLAGIRFVTKALSSGVRAAREGAHIHLGDASLAPLAWFIKKRVPTARISATASGLDLLYGARWYQKMLARTLPSIDCLCCNSHATGRVLRARGWKGKSVIIPCGVGPVTPRSAAPVGEMRLVGIGRLIPRKGFAWFVEHVLPLLRERNPGLTFTLVGSGPEHAAILRAVRQHGLQDCVHLVGGASDEERDGLLKEAHVLVVPNIPVRGDIEGFGIVCIEAGARGVPVAASYLEGLRDAVIPGVTGRLFAPQHPADCAQTIERMYQETWDPQRLASVVQQRFGQSHVLDRYHDVFFA
jgi:phosphatidyl-myo-inositol dimannoside synthase